MSLENNRKILIGSVIQSLDKRLILGETDNESVVLVSMIISYIEYAIKQQNLGNESYFQKIKVLNELVQQLKYKCPDVCIYKKRLIITKLNTAPIIDDNVIEIPISNSHQVLPYNEVVHNYRDAENDLISQVIILSTDLNNDLLIDNNPVVVNNTYQPNIEFSSKYKVGEDSYYIIKNSDTEPCSSEIVAVDNITYNNAIQNQQVVEVFENGNTVLQTINNNIEEIPNDTIIYIHIDTSSMAASDQETVRDVSIDWWNQFQIDNPSFQGSMVINTVPNDQISNDYATGRATNGIVSISGSTIKTGTVEAWLENPAEGLLRQAYKEGENTFVNEAAFQQYAQDKSIVVLTFVDETHNEYHATDSVGFVSTGQSIFQPTPSYITDYNNYLFKVRPFLKFFKGILYPITRVNNISNDNFQLHALAAMEATTLTSTEIDTQFGPDKVLDYGPTNMQTKFYDNLSTANPYSNLNGLKDSGWEGRFDKTSPASEVLSSQEFTQELNDILTDTSDVQISVLETTEIPAQNLGNSVQTSMDLKVKDNNPQQPLFSNQANILIRFTSECEAVPDCDGNTTAVNTPHKQNYVFNVADFTSDTNVDKIKLSSVIIPNGQLKYFNLIVTNSNLPIIISISDIAAGNLVFIPDNTIQTDYNIQLNYTLSFTGSINYCNNENIIEITKTANPNQPATVVTEDQTLELTSFSNTTTTTINTTVTYTGTGNYVQFWERISGATDVQLVNPTDEDLQLQNLKEGVYVFRITVITTEDGFVTSADSTITVLAPSNTAPSIDDVTVQLVPDGYQGRVDFEAGDFTSNFQDNESDTIGNVRITSLPLNGTIYNGTTPLIVGDVIPSQDIANINYIHNLDVVESSGVNYAFTEDLDTDIPTLESNGYNQTGNANGTLTYFREELVLTDDLIAENVDGTFDTVQGFITNSIADGAGNVDGGGWENGSGTADVIRPHTVAEGGVARGAVASPQGGNFAAANEGEELFTNIPVEAGEQYRVTFYQSNVGHNLDLGFNNNIGDQAFWTVTLGNETQNSANMSFQGYGNQTWTEITLIFNPVTTGTVQLSFRAGKSTGTYAYIGVDNIQIRGQVVNASTDTQTFNGTTINDSFTFEVSDNNINELYSNAQTINIE